MNYVGEVIGNGVFQGGACDGHGVKVEKEKALSRDDEAIPCRCRPLLWIWSYISSDDTSKRYKCDVTVVKVIYLSQTTQVRQDLTAVLITRDSASTNSMEGNNDEMWFLDDDYVVEDEEQLVDEGEHDVPFNVADVPQQLVTADAHAQRDVHSKEKS
ncbi:hypothetical protein EDC04DRAFT_2608907 [Pisolithus marmoratus]|nr:hypothetical protein EDC04DRAFT_2608907 [Pisolithus marmoratus]